jgi:hypothetical protein
MGAFYTNVTVRHADVEAVIAVLEKLGRDAFVSPAQNGAVVGPWNRRTSLTPSASTMI